MPTDQILSIRYDGQPATFQLAETRETAGQLAEAAELFKKAAGEAAEQAVRPPDGPLSRGRRARPTWRSSSPSGSRTPRTDLLRFVQTYPTSRHIIPAREDLARLQLSAGDFAGAEATIAELAKLPKAGDRAAVLHAKRPGQAGHARRGHLRARPADRRVPGQVGRRSARRRLAKAESLVGLKKFKEAEALVRQVIQAAPAEDVAAQAAAYNTLGDCLRAANRPKDALLAYLHTDLLYSKDKEEHPRALFQIEKLFRQLKQDGRADEYAQRLRQEYPRSQWLSAK